MKLNTLRLLLLSLAAASLVACGTPSDDQPADGGSGGSSVQGTAGTQGSGGATAGTGGSSGGGGGAGSVGTGHGGASAGGTVGTGGGTGGEVGGANGGNAASGRGGATAGTSGSAGASGRGGASGMAGTTGAAGTGGGGRGGASGTGGSPIGGNGGAGATGGAGLPQLTVNGTKLQDPSGKTIILRGSALIDIGALYYYAGQNISGITTRMDKVAAAGVQGHVVRLPVYPKVDYNGGSPTCSPCPYPVGTGPTASCTPTMPVSASDYVTKILKPAVDYATSKNLYVIVDYHQIDNATSGTSAADAKTFWTDIAPKFSGKSIVSMDIYMYSPGAGESIEIDNFRLASVKLPADPAKTLFTVLGTDLKATDAVDLTAKLKDNTITPPDTVK